jgi:hypothetical protein
VPRSAERPLLLGVAPRHALAFAARALGGGLSERELVVIFERAGALTLPAAADVAAAIAALESRGTGVTAFVPELTFPAIVAISAARRRVAPPLAGPLALASRRESLVAPAALPFGVTVETIASGESKPARYRFDADSRPAEIDEQLRAMQREVDENAIDIVRRNVANVAAGDVFSSAAEAAERGVLTGTGYPETLMTAPPRRGRVRLPAPAALRRRSTVAVARLGRSEMLRGHAAGVVARLHRDAGKFAAVVLVIDSAGGDLSAADRAWTLLRALEIPVVAYVHRAVSAGYLIASAANAIVANPCAEVGGVGVVSYRAGAEPLLRRAGFTRTAADAYPRERLGGARRGLAALSHELMLQRIAAARPAVDVETIRGGRLFAPRAAQELHLVDEIGTLDAALRTAASLAGISAEAMRVAAVGEGRWWSQLRRGRELVDALWRLQPFR